MPELARFYGLVIKMFFGDSEHGIPHIHILYGEYYAAFDIVNNEKIIGDLPPKACALVSEWIALHKEELLTIWKTQEFKKIEPLK